MGWTDPATTTVGELKTAAYFNINVRDNLNAIMGHLIVRKPSDESVISSTVLQNDDHLKLTMAANEVWLVHFFLYVVDTGGSTGDIQLALTWPTGSTSGLGLIESNTTGGFTRTRFQGSGIGASYDVTNTITICGPSGVIACGGTPGDLQLQWAQSTSSVNAVTMKANSTLWAVKLA